MRTGKEYAVDTFHEAETDEIKFDVFGYHRSFYASIKEELKTWLKDEWENWESEKPDWFNARAIGLVPEDMLPAVALQKMNDQGGRKKSIAAMEKAEVKAEKEKVERVADDGELVLPV